MARIPERKRGPQPHLSDPEYRSRWVALAATGMSRRGVAEAMGKDESTLRTWLSRGRAEPNVEPYGSFSRDYTQAERGLEAAASGTIAAWVVMLYKVAQENPLAVNTKHIETLLSVLRSRFPEEHGVSKHRKPEAAVTGAEWLEQHPLEHAQLVELMLEPPEVVRGALVETLGAVLRRELAEGWRPDAETAEALRGVLKPVDPLG